MANANFYNFSKRSNSTLAPNGAGTVISVYLKNETSLLKPVFRLNYASIPTFNYCSFGGRYYFITDIISIKDQLYDVYCTIDVLATYKANIQNTTAFVLYEVNGNNKLVDGRLPIKTDVIVTTDTVSYFSPYYNAIGCYLLTTANREGCFTYVLNDSQLRTLLSDLASWINGQINTNSVEETLKEVGSLIVGSGNVMSNIQGLTWVPFTASNLASQSRNVEIGLYISTLTALYVDGYQNISWTQRINIPWYFSDWRRNQPYSQIYIYIPYIGTVMIPAGNITGDSSLDCQFSVNKRTGAMAVNIYGTTSGEHVYTGSGMCGISVPIGATGFNAGSFVTGGIATAASLLSGNVLGAAANAINSLQSNPQSAGALAGGAGSGLSQNLIVDVVSHDISDVPSNMALGIPSFKTKTLSSISGYVQCENASVGGAMTETERESINSLLNGGIYIE